MKLLQKTFCELLECPNKFYLINCCYYKNEINIDNIFLKLYNILNQIIIDFYKLFTNERTYENLMKLTNQQTSLLLNNDLQSRNMKMKLLKWINNFYFYELHSEQPIIIGDTIRFNFCDIDFKVKLIKVYKQINESYTIQYYSISKFIKEAESSYDYERDYSLILQVLALDSQLKDYKNIVFEKKYLEYNQKAIRSFSKEEVDSLKEKYNSLITNIFKDDNNLTKKIFGSKCKYCSVRHICLNNQKIDYNSEIGRKYYNTISLLQNILKVENDFEKLKSIIISELGKLLELNKLIEIKIISYDALDLSLDKYMNIESKKKFILSLERYEFNYLSGKDYYYFYNIDSFNKQYLFFITKISLSQEDLMSLDLILSYFRTKIKQITYYNLAVIDRLTQIYNRGFLEQIINIELDYAKKNNLNYGIFMFDIDNFKKFNDTYGHQAGDEVLKKVASILKSVGGKNNLPIRFGGEEFLLLCSNINRTNLFNLADEIRKNIEKSVVLYNDLLLKVTISGGISLFPEDASDFKKLLFKVDELLYKSKENGKNQISK